MKKSIFTLSAMVGLVLLFTAIQVQAFQIVTRTMMEKETVTVTDLIKTVDNVVVLFDSSASTNQNVPGTNISKIKAAKDFLKDRNSWLPDLGYQAGLFNYTNFKTLLGTYEEIYAVQPYDREKFAAAIDQLPDKGEGPTNLLTCMLGLKKTVSGLTGSTAVIMFTDGIFTKQTGFTSPLTIAKEIAKDHDVRFYLISSATADKEMKLLNAVAKINAASRVIPMTTFLANPLYLSGALFTVKASSYERLVPVTRVVGLVTDDMLFDFNSAVIKSEYNDRLALLGEFLKINPDAFVAAGGFSDSTGDAQYNLALSKKRADSVKSYLVDKLGIGADRIVTLWYGELNPVGDNGTKEGRKLNRRVGIAVGGLN
ncbi:MAG: OmpA family protein [Pseudomonadota bacterium]